MLPRSYIRPTFCTCGVLGATSRATHVFVRPPFSQPHPNTGAWVYFKHKGWCYRAFEAKRVGPSDTGAAQAGGVYAAPESVSLQSSYTLGHSAGWKQAIAVHDESSASSSRNRHANLARLRAGAGAKQAVLSPPRHHTHTNTNSSEGSTRAQPAPALSSIQARYCSAEGIPSGGARGGRPRARMPPALRQLAAQRPK